MSAVVPAYLGWGNPERDKVQMRLYATDKSDSPRWASEPGGRVAEYACVENGGTEGDLYLVVRLGNRFLPADTVRAITEAIEAVVASHNAPPSDPAEAGHKDGSGASS